MSNKLFSVLGAAAAVAATAGCCVIDEMTLEDKQQPEIKSIVEKHSVNVNRKQELDKLCGKVWIPVYINGQESAANKAAADQAKTAQAYIEFDRSGKLNGFGGVNHFSGAFAVTAPDRLRFGAIAATLKAGSNLDYEMLFMAQLSDIDSFSALKNGEIEFKKRDVVMIRCKAVDPKQIKRAAAVRGKAVKAGAAAANPAMPTVDGALKK